MQLERRDGEMRNRLLGGDTEQAAIPEVGACDDRAPSPRWPDERRTRTLPNHLEPGQPPEEGAGGPKMSLSGRHLLTTAVSEYGSNCHLFHVKRHGYVRKRCSQ